MPRTIRDRRPWIDRSASRRSQRSRPTAATSARGSRFDLTQEPIATEADDEQEQRQHREVRSAIELARARLQRDARLAVRAEVDLQHEGDAVVLEVTIGKRMLAREL